MRTECGSLPEGTGRAIKQNLLLCRRRVYCEEEHFGLSHDVETPVPYDFPQQVNC